LGYLQKAKGSWSDFSKEFLDLLLVAHFPGSQQTGHPPERGTGEGIELDPLLSDRNMKWSIHGFKPYKSPRPDGITTAHIQQAPRSLATYTISSTGVLVSLDREISNSSAGEI